MIEASAGQKIFWRIFKTGFLLLIFFIPFAPALNIAPDFDIISSRLLILMFFLFWLIGIAFSGKKIPGITFQGLALAAIVIISGLSLIGAQELGWGLRKLLVFLSIFPLYFMATDFLNQPGRFKKLINVLAGGAVISGGLAIIQFASQFFIASSSITDFYANKIGPFFWGQTFSSIVEQNPSWFFDAAGRTLMRALGLFPDPHMLAFFLGLVSPIILSIFLFSKRKNPGLFVIYCVLLLALLLTFSRGGYLGLFFSTIVVLGSFWKRLTDKRKFLMATGLVLCLFLLFIFGQPVISRFISSFSISEGSSASRLQIWENSWQVFLAQPLSGVGLGNYPLTQDPLASYRNPITSHNLYLDVASETGIFGLLVWLFLISGSCLLLFLAIKKRKYQQDEFFAAINIGLLGSLVYFSVHSFFETAIFNPVVLAVFMIILALASSSSQYEHST